MRKAKVEDHWRHVYANSYRRYIKSFRYSNINGLGNGEIIFRGGLSAICGGNGVGKSTVLDAIAGTIISPDYAKNHIAHGRFLDTVLEAELMIDNIEVTRSIVFSNDNHSITGEFDCEITHINPATLASNVTSFLNKTTNFAEVLESLEPKIANTTEIKELSYIVGKQYESFEIYEIEDYSLERNEEDNSPDRNDVRMTFPYFRVASGGVAYSSETMGLGELSLFILFWTLNRISENSILLIEEPETYISPSSQKKFMDFMARMSDIKHIWIVLTTHSPSIVEQIPLNRITLLSRGDTGVTVIDTPSQFQLDEVLDKSHSYSGILLVEDPVAKVFLRSLLLRFASDVYQRYEILIAEGEGSLSRLKTCFPKESVWLEIAVVYDGDQRDKQEHGNIPHGFLPTTLSPEALLQQTTVKNLQRFSDTLNRPIVDLKVVLDALQGRDSHDWLEELSGRLGINKESLIDILVGICLDTNEGAKVQAIELIAMIRAAF
jgi:ABC-type multidrug transport system ATPase subunit